MTSAFFETMARRDILKLFENCSGPEQSTKLFSANSAPSCPPCGHRFILHSPVDWCVRSPPDQSASRPHFLRVRNRCRGEGWARPSGPTPHNKPQRLQCHIAVFEAIVPATDRLYRTPALVMPHNGLRSNVKAIIITRNEPQCPRSHTVSLEAIAPVAERRQQNQPTECHTVVSEAVLSP